MYKRSSKFHNKAWPSPRTRARKAEKVNADLLRQRNVRTSPASPALSNEEREQRRDDLRTLLGRLAGDLSAAEFLQSLSSADLEILVTELVRSGDLPRRCSDFGPSDDAKETSDLPRSDTMHSLLPVVDNLLRELRIGRVHDT
jgi:hypothetical protein